MVLGFGGWKKLWEKMGHSETERNKAAIEKVRDNLHKGREWLVMVVSSRGVGGLDGGCFVTGYAVELSPQEE